MENLKKNSVLDKDDEDLIERMIVQANSSLKLVKLPKEYEKHIGTITMLHKKDIARSLLKQQWHQELNQLGTEKIDFSIENSNNLYDDGKMKKLEQKLKSSMEGEALENALYALSGFGAELGQESAELIEKLHNMVESGSPEVFHLEAEDGEELDPKEIENLNYVMKEEGIDGLKRLGGELFNENKFAEIIGERLGIKKEEEKKSDINDKKD